MSQGLLRDLEERFTDDHVEVLRRAIGDNNSGERTDTYMVVDSLRIKTATSAQRAKHGVGACALLLTKYHVVCDVTHLGFPRDAAAQRRQLGHGQGSATAGGAHLG